MIHEEHAQHCVDVWKFSHGLVFVMIEVIGFA